MRWVLKMFKARFIGSLRHPISWLFIIFAILFSLLQVVMDTHTLEDPRIPVAVVLEDQGKLHKALMKKFHNNTSFSIEILTRDQAMRKLQKGKLEAVFVIKKDFSNQLATGNFKNIIEFYTSPTSSAPATLSEPIINNTLMLWIEEVMVEKTRVFLKSHSRELSLPEENDHRRYIQKVYSQGLSVKVQKVIDNKTNSISVATNSPVAACTKWYGALAVFYMIVGAGWVVDIKKEENYIRLQQIGIKLWQLLIGSGLAPLLICIIGWVTTYTICSVYTGFQVSTFIGLLLTIFLYFLGVLGVTMVIASFTSNTTVFMLLAPMVTFVNAVLGGLLVTYPEWAKFLESVSKFLPGRWFSITVDKVLSGVYFPPIGLIICSIGWMTLGLFRNGMNFSKEDCEKNK